MPKLEEDNKKMLFFVGETTIVRNTLSSLHLCLAIHMQTEMHSCSIIKAHLHKTKCI